MRIDDIRENLKNNHIKFDQWIESNEGYEPDVEPDDDFRKYEWLEKYLKN